MILLLLRLQRLRSFLFPLFSLFLTLLLAAPVTADYPGVLFPWKNNNCPDGYDFCGTLEFCRGDNTYGYRLPCTPTSFDYDPIEEEDCPCPGISGPLIRLQPGYKYQLTLRNSVKQSWIRTNLHTHGLHISGNGDSDDVTRSVSGGGGNNCLDYTWDIPKDHPGGTYWYHAHKHGSTEQQVGGGAYGMLIVEDNTFLNPNIPEYLTTNEVLLQAAVNYDTGMLLGNGNPDIEILPLQANVWYRLRVSMVSAEAVPSDLKFNDVNGMCDIYKVASDGIWRSQVPGPTTGTSFEMTGASRADFAIKCKNGSSSGEESSSSSSRSSTYLIDMTYGLYAEQHFASLEIGPTEPDATLYALPSTPWIPNRPDSLQDMTTLLSEDIPESNKFTIHLKYDTVNDVTWDKDVPLTELAFDEIHEWTLVGIHSHPFHLHLYHVQVVSAGCGPAHEIGEFYDVIASSSADEGDIDINNDSEEPCVVRFRTADIGQRCVVHCHVLMHEDNGSMAWVNVTDKGTGTMPRNDVVSLQYSCHAMIDTEMPSVVPSMSPSATPTLFPSSNQPSNGPTTTVVEEPPVPAPVRKTLSPTKAESSAGIAQLIEDTDGQPSTRSGAVATGGIVVSRLLLVVVMGGVVVFF